MTTLHADLSKAIFYTPAERKRLEAKRKIHGSNKPEKPLELAIIEKVRQDEKSN